MSKHNHPRNAPHKHEDAAGAPSKVAGGVFAIHLEDAMQNTQERLTRSKRRREAPLSLYRRLFGRPPLSVAERAKRAAQRYREWLRERFGDGVPTRKVIAFELVYRIALLFPECWEDIYAAGKAGCEEGQQCRAATGRGVSR